MKTGIAARSGLKTAAFISLLTMAALLVIAIVLYRDRIFFADTSFIAFSIANSGQLAVKNQRYGAFISQAVPYIAANLHLPLKALIFGYSVSFNAFFLSVCAILYFWFRQYRLTILMALYYLLMVSDSFYLENDEVHQGVAWLFLSVGFLLAYAGRARFYLLAAIFTCLLFLAISSHFIVIIPAIFLPVFLFLCREDWPFSTKRSIVIFACIAVTIAAKFLITTGQPYESNNLYPLTHLSFQDIFDSFSKPVVTIFFTNCITNYWLAALIFFAGVATAARGRGVWPVLWYLAFCAGYISVMGIVLGGYGEFFVLCHAETEWESFTIIIATPFVFLLLKELRISHAAVIMGVIYIVRLAYILHSDEIFRWRTEFKASVMAEMKKKNISKLALYRDDDKVRRCVLDWALPYETLLTSAIDGDRPQLTFLFANKDDTAVIARISSGAGFFDAWAMFDRQFLNPRYFAVDSSRYVFMTYGELMR